MSVNKIVLSLMIIALILQATNLYLTLHQEAIKGLSIKASQEKPKYFFRFSIPSPIISAYGPSIIAPKENYLEYIETLPYKSAIVSNKNRVLFVNISYA